MGAEMAKNIGLKQKMRQHMVDKHALQTDKGLEKEHNSDPLGQAIMK